MLYDLTSQTLSLCLDSKCQSHNQSIFSFDGFSPKSIDLKFQFRGFKEQFNFQQDQFIRTIFISVHDLTDYNAESSSYDFFKNNFANLIERLPKIYKPDTVNIESILEYKKINEFKQYPYHHPMIYLDVDNSLQSSSLNLPDLSDLQDSQKIEIQIDSDFDENRAIAGYTMLKELPSTINSLRSSEKDYYLANIVILFNADNLLINHKSENIYSIGQDIVDAWNSLDNNNQIMFIAIYDQSDEDKKSQWKEFFPKVFPDLDKVQKVSLPSFDGDQNKFDGLLTALNAYENNDMYCSCANLCGNTKVVALHDEYAGVSKNKLNQSYEKYYSSGADDNILIIEDILEGDDPEFILKDKKLKIFNSYCCMSERGWEILVDSRKDSSNLLQYPCNSIAFSLAKYFFK